MKKINHSNVEKSQANRVKVITKTTLIKRGEGLFDNPPWRFSKQDLLDMQCMRDEGKTGREIGNKYGISRERVRQLIGNKRRMI